MPYTPGSVNLCVVEQDPDPCEPATPVVVVPSSQTKSQVCWSFEPASVNVALTVTVEPTGWGATGAVVDVITGFALASTTSAVSLVVFVPSVAVSVTR